MQLARFLNSVFKKDGFILVDVNSKNYIIGNPKNDNPIKLKILDKAVFIEHVKGYVRLGETSIIIAVACKHRDEAYILSRYIIEEIKKRSPIWKKEHYQNSESNWLEGNPLIYENK